MLISKIIPVYIIVLCFDFSNANAREPKQIIVAHRGASGYATENTLSAFKLAIEQNANAIELDIWRTKDDSIIVFHDRNTKRLSDDSIVVPEVTYAQLRALSLPGDGYIPTLREVLGLLSPKTKVFIEIKCCWEVGKAGDVFPMVKEILKQTKTQKQAVFISFNPEKLVDAKKYMPSVPCYWLTGKKLSTQEYLNVLNKSKIEGINVHHSIASKELIGAAKKNRFGFFVWTVNDPELAKSLFFVLGVNGITTNYPDKMLKVLNSK